MGGPGANRASSTAVGLGVDEYDDIKEFAVPTSGDNTYGRAVSIDYGTVIVARSGFFGGGSFHAKSGGPRTYQVSRFRSAKSFYVPADTAYFANFKVLYGGRQHYGTTHSAFVGGN